MTLIILVVLLGGVGAAARAAAARSLPPLIGTLAANLIAAFLLGVSLQWSGVWAEALRVGLLGAASTWSTLAHELAELARQRRIRLLVIYAAGSLVLGTAAAWLGLQLG